MRPKISHQPVLPVVYIGFPDVVGGLQAAKAEIAQTRRKVSVSGAGARAVCRHCCRVGLAHRDLISVVRESEKSVFDFLVLEFGPESSGNRVSRALRRPRVTSPTSGTRKPPSFEHLLAHFGHIVVVSICTEASFTCLHWISLKVLNRHLR